MIKTIDGKEIVEDGERISIGVMLMDAQQKAVADKTVVFDTVGHKPGGMVLTDADKKKREQPYRDYDAVLAARWRSSPPPIIPTEAKRSIGDARSDAYEAYQERVSNAWRHQ